MTPLLTEFAKIHHLPESYIQTAKQFFLPLCERLADQARHSDKPLLIGIHGCQGSGKSTLTDLLLFLLNRRYSIAAVGMSIDDFYLTRSERIALSNQVHPLFKTRGVPGTHDVRLLHSVLSALLENQLPVSVPVFNKAIDDRRPESEWTQAVQSASVVILEGWCVGVRAEDEATLRQPINELERQEDAEGIWRSYSNSKLKHEYQSVFGMLDQLIMLKAPGFHTVFQWRLEQEKRLVAAMNKNEATTHVMDEASVSRFIQHYQRITELALNTLPNVADVVYELDESRNIHKEIVRGK